MGECEPRNFLQPCLLLLLCERSDHGYDLVDRLRELHAVDGDAGAVYRALRGLEKAGMVRSSWEASEAGPARRTYQVTPLGMATLDRQADLLEETHRTLHLFRQRYRELVGAVPPVAAAPGTTAILVAANGNGRHHGVPTRGAGEIEFAVNGDRRNGDGVTPGGAPDDPGGRGVRPPIVPGQRTGG
jgi:poly-beta-hydroxybutyrate-responsive repressor